MHTVVVVTKARELRLRSYLSLSKLGSSPMALFHSSCRPLVFCQRGNSSQLQFISVHSIYICTQTNQTKGYFRVFFLTTLQHTNFLAFVFLPCFWHRPLTGSYQIRPALLAFSNQSTRDIEREIQILNQV